MSILLKKFHNLSWTGYCAMHYVVRQLIEATGFLVSLVMSILSIVSGFAYLIGSQEKMAKTIFMICIMFVFLTLLIATHIFMRRPETRFIVIFFGLVALVFSTYIYHDANLFLTSGHWQISGAIIISVLACVWPSWREPVDSGY